MEGAFPCPSGNLFLEYDVADTGARPLPANPARLPGSAPRCGCKPPTATIRFGQPVMIEVQVSLMSPAAYTIINVEVWVCDPTTVAGPSTALPPFQGATAQQLTLTGDAPQDPSQAISMGPRIQVTGFVPYPGISSLPGGHCCLIANCYGTTGEGTGQRVPPHYAGPGGQPPQRGTDLPARGAAQHLRGRHASGLEDKRDQLPVPRRDAAQGGRRAGDAGDRRDAPGAVADNPGTRPAPVPVRREVRGLAAGDDGAACLADFGLTGLPKEGRAVELELEAHKSQVLTATVELDPAERLVGRGVPVPYIEQRDAKGRAQRGFRRGHSSPRDSHGWPSSPDPPQTFTTRTALGAHHWALRLSGSGWRRSAPHQPASGRDGVRLPRLEKRQPVDPQNGEPGRRLPDRALTFPRRLRCASVSQSALTSDELEDAVARALGRAFSRARRELPAADVLDE